MWRVANEIGVLYLCCVIGLLFVAGCSNEQAMDDIARAEQVVEENPTEALAILDGIDYSELSSEEAKARYTLICSEAHYYDGSTFYGDVQSEQMMRYYLESDNHAERARAMYQHALSVYDMGEGARALVSLMEAESSLKHAPDTKLEGLVARQKGYVYNDGGLYANAVEAYKAAKECFEAAGLKEHVVYMDYDIGGTLIQLHNFEEASTYLNSVLDYATEHDDKSLMCAVLHELLDLVVYEEEYDLCRRYIAMFDDYDCLTYGEAHYLAAKAMLVAHDGDRDAAWALADMAEVAEDSDWAEVEYARYIICRNVGDAEGALYWHEESKHSQDEFMLEILEQPVLNAEVERLRTELNAEMRERELTRQRNMTIYVSVAVVVLLVIVGIIVYARHRIRRKDGEIRDYMETIESLRSDLDRLPREMSSSIASLYRDRFSELNELCDIYYDHSGSSRHKSMVFNKMTDTIARIKEDESRIEELEVAVNAYRDNAMQRLEELLPKMSERNHRVALYSFAGFSNRAIALFIDSDPVAVSKIKYNIKQKIKACEAADGEELIAALSDK